MKSWYFSEQSYYPAWDIAPDTPRVDAPSRNVDPAVAHRLLNEYFDQCVLADELGLNIMVNEHHAAYSCMSVSCMITLGILAAKTKNARLLALGIPLMNRMDPVRVAEEIAYVDNISGGRLEVGLVKGTPLEMFISNVNPVRSTERYWEAHELVLAALKHTDGPFSWESEHFNYRYVNVIPRCYQQPTPQMWITTTSTSSAPDAAQRDCVIGIPGNAHAARAAFPIYREAYQKAHGRPAPQERIAYLGLVVVAEDHDEAMERGRKVLRFPESLERTRQDYINPPGALPHAANAQFLRNGATVSHRNKTLPDGTPMSDPPTPEQQIINQTLFAGTPDEVYEQIKLFSDSVGGFGNFLIQMGGTMSHDEICDSLTLYTKHVQPRLESLNRERAEAAE